MAKRPAKPANMPWMAPALTVKDADAAVAFYQKAFGFEKRFSMPGPDGRSIHAEVAWHDCAFMLGPENDMGPCKSPATLGVRPSSSLYVYCDDVDAVFKRATAAARRSICRRKTSSGAIACVRSSIPTATSGASPPTSPTSIPRKPRKAAQRNKNEATSLDATTHDDVSLVPTQGAWERNFSTLPRRMIC